MIRFCLLVFIASTIQISLCSPEEMMEMMKMSMGPPETLTECLEDTMAELEMDKSAVKDMMANKWACKEKVMPDELKKCIPEEEVRAKILDMKMKMMDEYMEYKKTARDCLLKKAEEGLEKGGCSNEPLNFGPCAFDIMMEMVPKQTNKDIHMCMRDGSKNHMETMVNDIVSKISNPERKAKGQKFINDVMKPMMEFFKKDKMGGSEDGGPPFGKGKGAGPPMLPNGGPPFGKGKGPLGGPPFGKGKGFGSPLGEPPFGKGKGGKGGKGKDGKGGDFCFMAFCTPKALAECGREAKLDEALEKKSQRMYDMMKYMDDEVIPATCECMKPLSDTTKLLQMMGVEELDCKKMATKEICDNFMNSKVQMHTDEIKAMMMMGEESVAASASVNAEIGASRRKRSTNQLLKDMFSERFNDWEAYEF